MTDVYTVSHLYQGRPFLPAPQIFTLCRNLIFSPDFANTGYSLDLKLLSVKTNTFPLIFKKISLLNNSTFVCSNSIFISHRHAIPNSHEIKIPFWESNENPERTTDLWEKYKENYRYHVRWLNTSTHTYVQWHITKYLSDWSLWFIILLDLKQS